MSVVGIIAHALCARRLCEQEVEGAERILIQCPQAGSGCPVFSYPQYNVFTRLSTVVITPTIPDPTNVGAFQAQQPLPPGLSLNTTSGVISGRAIVNGVYTVSVVGTNTNSGTFDFYNGNTLTVVVGITVVPPANPVSLTFVDSDNKAGSYGGVAVIGWPGSVAAEAEIATYELRWAYDASGSLCTLSTSLLLGGIVPVGGNVTVQVPRGSTPSSSQCTYLAAYSRNVTLGLFPATRQLSDFNSPVGNPSAVTFADTDPHMGVYGGVVVVNGSALDGDVTGYDLYWGVGGSVLASLANVSKGGNGTAGVTTYVVPQGSVPPSGATTIIVYSKNANGEGSYPVTTSLGDYAPAIPVLSCDRGVNGSTSVFDTMVVTVTFNQAVPSWSSSSLAVSSSGSAVSKGAAVLVSSGGSGVASVYNVTLNFGLPLVASELSVSVTPSSSGGGNPAVIAPLEGAFALSYRPPVPTLTSSIGSNGTSTTGRSFNVTLTFSSAVVPTSVSGADLAVTASPAWVTVVKTVSVVSSSVFVVGVVVQTPLVASTLTFSVASGSIAISPRPAASTSSFVVVYSPPTVTLSSSVGPSTPLNQFNFTATFSTAVASVDARDFALQTVPASLVTTGVLFVVSSSVYVLQVTCVSGLTAGSVSVGFVSASNNISPANNASASRLSVQYTPPTVTLSSSAGPSGSVFTSGVVSFVATFSSGVSNVNSSDFIVNSNGTAVSTSVSGSGTVWTLTVAVTGRSSRLPLSVHMNERSGQISPPNVASNGSVIVIFSPPQMSLSSRNGTTLTGSSFIVDAVFTSAVSGVQASDFVASSGVASVQLLTSPSTVPTTVWSVLMTMSRPATGRNITVTFNGASSAAFPSLDTAWIVAPLTVTYTPPVGVLSLLSRGGSSTTSTNQPWINCSVTFPVAVLGLSSRDVSVSVPTAITVSGGVNVSGGPLVYTVSVLLTPATASSLVGVQSSVSVSVLASDASSSAVPAIAASPVFVVTFDQVAPSFVPPVVLNKQVYVANDVLVVFVNFTKAVSSATLSLFSAPNTRAVAVSNAVQVASGGMIGAQFSTVIQSSDPRGDLNMSLSLTDVSGNTAVVPLSDTRNQVFVDPRPPAIVSFTVSSGSRVHTGDTIDFILTADEALSSFSVLNVTIGDVTMSLTPPQFNGYSNVADFQVSVGPQTKSSAIGLVAHLVDLAGNVNDTVPSLTGGGVMPVIVSDVSMVNANATQSSVHNGAGLIVVVTFSRNSSASVPPSFPACNYLTVSPSSLSITPTSTPAGYASSSGTPSFACVVSNSGVGAVTVSLPADAFVGVYNDATSVVFPFAIPYNGPSQPSVRVNTSAASVGPPAVLPYSGKSLLQYQWSVVSSSCSTPPFLRFSNRTVASLLSLLPGCSYTVSVTMTDPRAVSSPTSVMYSVYWPAVSTPATPTLRWCVVGSSCVVTFGAAGFPVSSSVSFGLWSGSSGAFYVFPADNDTTVGGDVIVGTASPSLNGTASIVIGDDAAVGQYALVTVLQALSGADASSPVAVIGPTFEVRALPYRIAPSSIWGGCSASCGMGVQWRRLVCLWNTGVEMDVESCPLAPLPSWLPDGNGLSQNCMLGACNDSSVGGASVAWFTGSYGSCSVSCGGGVQTRVVECRDVANVVQADSVCLSAAPGVPKPWPNRTCGTGHCESSYSIVASGWSSCSVPCGAGGQQVRSLACVGSGGSSGVFRTNCASSALLSAVPSASLSSSAALQVSSCPGVNCTSFVLAQGGYSHCLSSSVVTNDTTVVSCGGGVRYREDTCVDPSNGFSAVPLSQCGLSSTVDVSTTVSVPCGTSSCVVPQWDVGPFGPCNGSDSGLCGGSRSRLVRCVDAVTRAVLSASACTSAIAMAAPASDEVCSDCAGASCPANCTLHGTCSASGVCQCFSGYSGTSCQTPSGCAGGAW